jgi:hypothetical protein
MAEAATNKYTFGDNRRASARLRRLAELYEPESRDLLRRSGIRAPRLAVDLGCGPGWSTRLLEAALKPDRTVGLDASACLWRRRGPGMARVSSSRSTTSCAFRSRSPLRMSCSAGSC